MSTLEGPKRIGIRSKKQTPALQADMAIGFLIFRILIFSILTPPRPVTKDGDGWYLLTFIYINDSKVRRFGGYELHPHKNVLLG